jgi:hypothetical protein
MESKSRESAVIVCTDKRGVFFGYTSDTPQSIIAAKTVTLARTRMCVHWSAKTKGVLGLAADGPAAGSRITDAVPSVTLDGIHAVLELTERAIKRWEDLPWS